MDALSLIVLSLATWRVAAMFVKETGPGFMFQKIRESVGITHDRDGNILVVPDKFLPGLLSCVWCASVWIGAGWVLFWYLLPQISIVVAAIFCVSAGAIAFDHLLGGRNTP